MNPPIDEDFVHFESKVNQIMKILEDIGNATKTDAEGGRKEAPQKPVEVDEDNFILTVRENRSVINKSSDESTKSTKQTHLKMDKFTFMQQMEQDANERAKAREEQQRIAQNFRALGNEAFRKQQYEKAINMYTKAIDHIKDSPILYNNRALSYIKLKNLRRGIIDCDYVLNNLDERNLRSWLYRASAYKRLNDEKNYENSIMFAKKHNTKAGEFIDNFIEKMKTDLF